MNHLNLKGFLKSPASILRAGRFPMGSGNRDHTYSHPSTALHLHHYPGRIHIGGRRFELEPGDVTLTPAHTLSSYDIRQAGTHLCIHFFPGSLSRSGQSLKLPLHCRPAEQSPFIADGFARVIGFHQRSTQCGRAGTLAAAAAAAGLQELLIALALIGEEKKRNSRSGRAGSALKKLASLIDERFAEPWTAAALASASGLSQDYISFLFHQHYGMNIARALLMRRMEVARHLLQTSDLPIKAVGASVGIPDAQYFNKQFRRINGSSPSAFLLHASGRA